ncbi:4518_t:CDS:1, partial [Acaulospora colombiana]
VVSVTDTPLQNSTQDIRIQQQRIQLFMQKLDKHMDQMYNT